VGEERQGALFASRGLPEGPDPAMLEGIGLVSRASTGPRRNTKESPVMRIAHISDFHLPSRPGRQVNGAYPYENLKKAVGEIKRQSPKVDLIVLGGDLFEDGDKADYAPVFELFGELQVPVHAVVGNHDHLPSLRKAAGPAANGNATGYYSFDQGGHHCVILNSAGTGKPYGRLEEPQLLWLSADLHEHRFKPILIFMHHPPFDSGVGWLDKIRLLNVEGFWGIIPPFAGNILGVFVSHLHLAVTCRYRQTLLVSSPGVCWQYAGGGDAAKSALSDEPPGFNLIDVAKAQLAVRTVRFAAASPAEAAAGEAGTAAGQPAAEDPPGKAGTGAGAS
jgi:Icc protein